MKQFSFIKTVFLLRDKVMGSDVLECAKLVCKDDPQTSAGVGRVEERKGRGCHTARCAHRSRVLTDRLN